MSTIDSHELFSPLGDADAEEHACRYTGGLLDRGWVDRLEMVGADRGRFLNGLVTCDVKGLAPGTGTNGFITQIKGRILADLVVLALEDRLWLELPTGHGEALRTHLEKYILADRVEITVLERRPLTLLGPRVEEVLEEAFGERVFADDPWTHGVARCGEIEVRWVSHPDLGGPTWTVPMWTVWAEPSGVAEVTTRLLEIGAAHGMERIGREAWKRLRVASGWPLYGRDVDDNNFPKELEPYAEGFEGAVSYEKGCYLGQEVIARIHYRGGVTRHLRGVVLTEGFDGSGLEGRRVLADRREAGTLTSVAFVEGRWLGLAILNKRVEPGARVEIEGGGAGEVVELPFDL